MKETSKLQNTLQICYFVKVTARHIIRSVLTDTYSKTYNHNLYFPQGITLFYKNGIF